MARPARLRFAALFATGAVTLIAATPPVLTGDAAADHRALAHYHRIHEPAGVERGSDAHFDHTLQRARTLRELGLRYLEAHPTDPRRWDVLILLQHSGNLRISYRADGSRYADLPAAEAALWRQEYLGRLEDLLESTDAGRGARHEALLQLIDYYCGEIRAAKIDNPRRGLVPSLLDWVREFRSLDPRSGRLSLLYLRVARMLNALDSGQCLAFLAEQEIYHAGSSEFDAGVRQDIASFRRLVRNQDEPADELWSHLRRIDPTFEPAAYRGKVVLIARLPVDWTTPIRELESLHRQHHEAGLEIVQIAYENRSVTIVSDGTGKNTRQPPLVQRDKSAMQRYVAERNWPWPVLWEVATFREAFPRVWGLNSVPAYLLVRRDGRIAREIPGEQKLGLRIARELGLPAR